MAGKLTKQKSYQTNELSLSGNISGTRFECHKKLDLFLDKLISKIPNDEGDSCGNFTFRFEVTQQGYDSFNEESIFVFPVVSSNSISNGVSGSYKCPLN